MLTPGPGPGGLSGLAAALGGTTTVTTFAASRGCFLAMAAILAMGTMAATSAAG